MMECKHNVVREKVMFRNILSIGLTCLVSFLFMTQLVDAEKHRPMIRLIYFVPSDRQPQPDIDKKMDALNKGCSADLRR